MAQLKPVTIVDVAREAGVSYSTVSRVVNNKDYIVPEKRARVLAAIERLGYVPNIQARKLAGGRAQVVGLVLHDLWSSYAVEILRGIDAELASEQYDLMLYTSHGRPATESVYVSTLTQGLAEGLLLLLPRGLSAYIGGLTERQFPYVLIDHEGVPGVERAVGATNRQGAYDATRHLLALGHRRIGFITGKLEVGASKDRLAGYRAALEACDTPIDEALIVQGDFLRPRAQEAARQLLQRTPTPTAIFASNDVSAFGVMDVARERGLAIPDDLSVVGFDDIPEAANVHPALTTVRQPLEEMGRVAARMLLRMMREHERPSERLELPTELIVRSSTARCPRQPLIAPDKTPRVK
jgi:LacI family transcriptional regulator